MINWHLTNEKNEVMGVTVAKAVSSRIAWCWPKLEIWCTEQQTFQNFQIQSRWFIYKTGHSLQSIYLIKGDLEVVFDPSQDAWVKPVSYLVMSLCLWNLVYPCFSKGAVSLSATCAETPWPAMAASGRCAAKKRGKGDPGLPWSQCFKPLEMPFWGSPPKRHPRPTWKPLNSHMAGFAGHIGHISRQTCVQNLEPKSEGICFGGVDLKKTHLSLSTCWNVRSIGAKKFWSSVRQWVLSRCIWSCTHANNLQKLGYKNWYFMKIWYNYGHRPTC